MSKTDGTPLTPAERQQLAFLVGDWSTRPCANRPEDPICEASDCNVWYRGEELLYAEVDTLPLDMDMALTWLKKQDRMIHITGGTPEVMWQVRVSRSGKRFEEHILFSRSRNAIRLEDAVLRAAYDVMVGVLP